MTKEEALQAWICMRNEIDNENWLFVGTINPQMVDVAIEALQDDWIPVSEPPKENGNYIVSLEDSIYPWGRFFNGKWFMLSTDGIAREFSEHEVRAWKPLSEPYKENKYGN